MLDELSITASRTKSEETISSNQSQSLSCILQNVQVCYAMTFLWVKEIFSQTGVTSELSSRGFTLYDTINDLFAFDTFNSDLQQWNVQSVRKSQTFKIFFQYMCGIGPKIVLRELVQIGQLYLNLRKTLCPPKSLTQLTKKLSLADQFQLNSKYVYLRFSQIVLSKLGISQNCLKVKEKVRQLWFAFVTIYVYSLYCLDIQKPNNQYRLLILRNMTNQNDASSSFSLSKIVQQAEQSFFLKKQKDYQCSFNQFIPLDNSQQMSNNQEKRCSKHQINKIDRTQKSDQTKFVDEQTKLNH